MFIQTSNPNVELLEPHFCCPRCQTQRPYTLKPASIDFTFYYISLFGAPDLTEFVVCQVCKNGFDPQILQPGNQSLLKLVGATRHALLHSSTPGSLKLRFMSDGLKEEFVDKLIALARG